jgi:hypothetical protein
MAESSATKFALIKKEFEEIYKDICKLVSKSEFVSEIKRLDARINPIEKIVYTTMGAILLGFLGAIISFFIRQI